MAIQMTRAEYEAKYGAKPQASIATPVKMTRAEYDKKYGIKTEAPKSLMQKTADVITTIFPGKRIGEALATPLAKAMVPKEQRQFVSTDGPTKAQLAGDLLQVGAFFAPIGKAASAIGLGAKAIGLGKIAKPLGNIGAGLGVGYGVDVGMNLSEGKTGSAVTSPGLGTVIGGAIPAVAPLSKGVARLGGEVLGKTTGAGFGTIREGLEATVAGGKRATAFREALRGGTEPDKIVDEAKNSLSEIINKRRSVYQEQLSKIADNKQSLDISPVVNEVGKQLKKFNVAVLEDGTLDFSRSSLRFNKPAQNDITTIIQEMKGFGTKEGDRTALGIDSLKRAFGDLYTPSGEARAFVQAVKSETRKILSRVPGYDDLAKNYGDKTDLIDEIRRGLSLGDKAQTDTAFRKLTSALRQNNEFRKELVKELDEATGGELLAKIAGQQLSEILPRGLVGPIGAIGGTGAILTGVGLAKLIPATMAFSPRLVGELVSALGFTGNTAKRAIQIIEKNAGKLQFPGDAIIDRVKAIPGNKQGGFIKIPGIPESPLGKQLPKMQKIGNKAYSTTLPPNKKLSTPVASKVGSEANPLLQEAKKYKSAEEFVNKKGTWFRGAENEVTPENIVSHFTTDSRSDLGDGLYLTSSQVNAGAYGDSFSKSGRGKVTQLGVSDNAKIFDMHGQSSKATLDFSDFINLREELANKIDERTGGYLLRMDKKSLENMYGNNNQGYYSAMQDLYQRAGEKGTLNKVNNVIKSKGFDAITIPQNETVIGNFAPEYNANAQNLLVFNKDIIKTKSQLTDIWNKANNGSKVDTLISEAKKYKSAEEFVRKESFNPNSTIEYHLSDNPNLVEGKTFAEQVKPNNIGERGFGGREENIGEIFSTKSPQSWSAQLNYEGNKKPQYVYLVEVKTPGKVDIMEGLPQQSINPPQDVRILKKIGGQKVIDNPSIAESVKQSELTDIWNKAQGKTTLPKRK